MPVVGSLRTRFTLGDLFVSGVDPRDLGRRQRDAFRWQPLRNHKIGMTLTDQTVVGLADSAGRGAGRHAENCVRIFDSIVLRADMENPDAGIVGRVEAEMPGDFSQVPKTFDGAATYVRVGDLTVTPFWTLAVPIVHTYRFNESTSDQQLFGIFSTSSLRPLSMELDLYWLGVNNAAATFNGTSGREQRHTLGARSKGKIGQTNLDFDVEAAGQFGAVGNGDIAAGMFTAVLGYTLPAPALAP